MSWLLGIFLKKFIFKSGVDICHAASSPVFSGTLQFVSGLGPRKAQAMIAKINRKFGGKLQSRQDLIEGEICSANIFMNCASFIRIKERHFLNKRHLYGIDPLDDSRIHPEDYDIARKMAADALDVDDTTADLENPSQHVIEIMENDSQRLYMLMLDDYADELERSEHKLKKIALNEMREELIAPYSEKRRNFEGASKEEVFTMLTSETKETLRIGTLVNCMVTKVKDRFVGCVHDSGMECSIHINRMDVPMDRANDLQSFFTNGTTVAARVVEVNMDRLTLELDARKQSVLSKEFNFVERDPTFSKDREAVDLDSICMN
jgi:transcription elongation factor SPT6